jgi:hypothetical protein
MRKQHVLLFGVGFVLTTLLVLLASVPRYSAFGICLLPGALGAALIFPQGIDSDWPYLYMTLAFVLNGALSGFIVSAVWRIGRVAMGRFDSRYSRQ